MAHKILFRASRSPFENFYNGAIPASSYLAMHAALEQVETKNAGNLLFAHAAYKALSVPGLQIDVDRYSACQLDSFADQAGRINEQYDAFVMPMCNSFRLDFKQSLARLTRFIKKLNIPVIVPGIGAQLSLDSDHETRTSMDEEVKDFVRAVLDRSSSIGVRGEITKRYLIELGFPADLIDIIGCPSMFYNGEHMDIVKSEKIGAVALNLTTILDPQIYNFTKYFNAHPENVTYIPQVRRLMALLGCGLGPSSNAIPTLRFPVPALMRPSHMAFFYDVVPWMDFLRTQSFSIGTRIHGNIIALIAGTPAHVVAHDSRTLEMARYFEIPHSKLNELSDFDLGRVYEASDYSGLMKNHSERCRTYARFLERNGLDHILYKPEQMQAYDARLRLSLESARLPTVERRARKAPTEVKLRYVYKYVRASVQRVAGYMPY